MLRDAEGVAASEAEQEAAARNNQGNNNPRRSVTMSFWRDRPQEAIHIVLEVTLQWVENRIEQLCGATKAHIKECYAPGHWEGQRHEVDLYLARSIIPNRFQSV